MSSRKYQFSSEFYFQISIDKIIPGKKRMFPLFIFFEINNHLVLRYWPGENMEEEEKKHFLNKGLTSFWTPKEFELSFQSYLTEPDTVILPNKADKPDSEKIQARSQEAEVAIELLTSDNFTKDEKVKALGYISKEMLSVFSLSDDKNPEEVQKVFGKCKEFTEDIVLVAMQAYNNKSVYEEIVKIQSDKDVEHSTAVSTLAVIFALGLGYTDMETLADISLAALLHDLGHVDIDPVLLVVPTRIYDSQQLEDFSKHINLGLSLLKENGVELSASVEKLITEHHERFNGSGFPKKIKNLELEELPQLVGMADMYDDIMKGQFDGNMKSPKEAAMFLKDLQAKAKPGLFNPEVFTNVYQLLQL